MNNKIVAYTVLSVLLAGCSTVKAPQKEIIDYSQINHHVHDQGIEISKEDAIPTVHLTIHEDPKAGWNLELTTTNFRFAPEHASRDHISGEGHAHLYVDDEEIGRLYGNWHHISKLDTGEHSIKVNLNANNHSPLLHKGEGIEAIGEIIVK